MEKLNGFFKSKLVLALSAIIIVSVFTISIVRASTSIGNDINTAGQLIVAGLSELDGGITVHDSGFVVKYHDNNGYVGINVADPQDALDIHGNLRFSNVMYPDIRLGSGVEALSLRSTSNEGNFINVSEKYLAGYQDADNRFQITTYNNENSYISTGGNFGVGTITPTAKLEVNGGVKLNTVTAKPVCSDATNRGTFWVTQGGTGVADSVEVCAKDASNAYAWRTIY
ncbi:MAG: hypothetical protein NTY12_00200 [Candidatus Falkowbacteria bacterium]|nr:hypothetical protein [Candidatus Falkowbacteria bacterium]